MDRCHPTWCAQPTRGPLPLFGPGLALLGLELPPPARPLPRVLPAWQYKRFFLKIDLDGSGELDEDEFWTFLSSHSRLHWLSPTQSRAVFQILDPNHGGTVSYKELAKAVFPKMDTTRLPAPEGGPAAVEVEERRESTPDSADVRAELALLKAKVVRLESQLQESQDAVLNRLDKVLAAVERPAVVEFKRL